MRCPPYISLLIGSGRGCPLLRASNEHHPSNCSFKACFHFILGREYPCWSACGRRTRPFSGRAFREHMTSMGTPCLSFSSCAFCEQEGHLAAPFSSFGGRALREQGERPSRSCALRLHYHIHVGRHTIRPLLIRHPQLEPIGSFFRYGRREEGGLGVIHVQHRDLVASYLTP